MSFKTLRSKPRARRTFLYLRGVAGNYASVPDEAALDITGDIDIRADIAADDYTLGSTQDLIAKWDITGDQRSYLFLLTATGILTLKWTTDGAAGTLAGASSSVAVGFENGARKHVRATLDVDNGASSYELKFYTSDDGESWSQLGSTRTGSVTSIHSGSAAATVGQRVGGGTPFKGKLHSAQIYSGIAGTKVLDIDFTDPTHYAASQFYLNAVTGQVVRIRET